MKSVAEAIHIPFFIPPMNNRKYHHVISRGNRPKFYRIDDLRDIGTGNTPWVDTFEKLFLGLYLALDSPVPYAFKTPDGKVRSLDAGCLKMLVNRTPPELRFDVGLDGYITSVHPTDALISRYALIHVKLRDRIVNATANEE